MIATIFATVVLWNGQEKLTRDGLRMPPDRRVIVWEPILAVATEAACRPKETTGTTARDVSGHPVYSFAQCLPDTIDPRGPKGGGR
jgi:hypothetical protein